MGQPNEGEELISIGLDGELPLDLNPYGYMYLSGFIPEQGVNTFALNLETNTLEEVTTSGNNSEFAPFDGSHALFSTVSNAESGQTEIVIADFSNETYLQLPTPPGYYKRNIQGFAGEHDGIAYSNRTETASEDDVFFDPTYWQVVVGIPVLQTFDTIPESFSPVYLKERNEIIVAKPDGIYSYNLETKNTYRIETGLSGLKADTEIVISPDRSKMILTAPIDNSLMVFDLEVGDVITAQTAGVITVPGRHFLSPIISPDNRFYAVFAFSDGEDNPQAQVEMRAFESKELVSALPVENFEHRSLRLHAWTTNLILDTAQEHGHDGADESADHDH